ncbi:hypothetical protein QZH41_001377 [Actinostola sp. cb2023]|nr:hypothetical protein QZH41_001377 [Actinostola sp. cb2023]
MSDKTLHRVVKNILDEPIPEAVKKESLKPLLPGKPRPIPKPRKKRKAILEEFDPVSPQKVRTIQDYQRDVLEAFAPQKQDRKLVFHQTPWVIGKFLRGWQMDVPQGHRLGSDPKAFLEGVRLQIREKLIEELRDLGGVKFQLALKIKLSKPAADGSEEYTNPVLRHKQVALLQAGEIGEALDKAIPHILEVLEKWTQKGSGWMVDQVETLWLDIARYQPLRGGSYIILPAEVRNKKAVINVKNKDDHCLRWTLRSALFPATHHVDRPSQYPTKDNLKGVDAPTPIPQISKVEKQNNLAINVFGWDKGVIVHHLSKQPEGIPRINTLLIEKAGKFHYTWITDLNRLLYDQSKHREHKHFCERCLHGYSREDLLEAHRPECRGIGQTAVRVEMPEESENKLTFQNHHKQMPAPYIIYADFEALTTKVEGPDRPPPPVEYRGPNAAEHFLQAIQEEEKKIKTVLANPNFMRMTQEDWRAHDTASHCHVCEKPLVVEGKLDSVRDHCHITGKYRGAAHNLKLRLSPKTTVIPVVFHNLRGYDSHLLMQAISKVEGRISCIPNNTEKYISFSLNQLRFIDSAQFLLAPLDKLVEANQPEVFQITAKYEPAEERRKLLLRKGVYPYEYMDSWERFEECQLPPKEAFYSKLSDTHISDQDYTHAQKVWEVFGCKTMGDYHDLYCRTDVLLLADIFEVFRKTCREHYKLDPAHYYTSPGLSWDALLRKTWIELELLTDYDMYLFIEKGLRGGISMVSKRHAKANNHLVEGYDSSKPSIHLLYLDANNLYGWAMSQPLPVGNFRWVENCHTLEGTITEHPADSPEGYILEVDLEYPVELHKSHNAYPLAPERMVVPKEWMSEYQHNLLGVGVAPTELEKLVPNLRNKEHYVVHYRTLYLSLGMRLTKIHRALCFTQKPWMEPYIRMNTELRKKATSTFEKDLYKLMNNSVFGKTTENLRKRVDVKLVRASEEDKLRRLIASPAFARANIFDDDLAAIQVHKSRLVLNRPVYVGMAILNLSKMLMYDFYYNQLKVQYGERCQLLYTDMDSLLLEIQTDDVYKDMAEHAELYDTSDYPQDHPLYTDIRKKIPGKMKDECAGRPIAEYVGLRPKMYSILEASWKNIKKAKGIRKATVKNHIRHEQYREALFEKKTFRHGMDVLRSERHHIYGQHLNKVSLSPFDSKRWIAENGVDTLGYGYQDAADTDELSAFLDELLGVETL